MSDLSDNRQPTTKTSGTQNVLPTTDTQQSGQAQGPAPTDNLPVRFDIFFKALFPVGHDVEALVFEVFVL